MAYTHTHTHKENGEDVLVGLQNNASVRENSLAVPQKAKHELLYDLTILHLGTYPRKMKTYICTKICTPSFIAAFFTIEKNPSVYQIMNK